MRFNTHQSVKVLTGKYAGACGVVAGCREETGMVQVNVQFFVNGEIKEVLSWLKFAQVEVL